MTIKATVVRIFDQETGEEFEGKIWGQDIPTTKKVYKEPYFTISEEPWTEWPPVETIVMEVSGDGKVINKIVEGGK